MRLADPDSTRGCWIEVGLLAISLGVVSVFVGWADCGRVFIAGFGSAYFATIFVHPDRQQGKPDIERLPVSAYAWALLALFLIAETTHSWKEHEKMMGQLWAPVLIGVGVVDFMTREEIKAKKEKWESRPKSR